MGFHIMVLIKVMPITLTTRHMITSTSATSIGSYTCIFHIALQASYCFGIRGAARRRARGVRVWCFRLIIDARLPLFCEV